MHITAEFITSAARFDQLPKEKLPEIALAGRSNVGKSSMINALVGKPGLARTSNTPGRTQTLNYYRITLDEKIGKSFYLVDMPGYGYAAINKGSRVRLSNLIERYLSMHSMLRGVIQLIDMRHSPQPLDHIMVQLLQEYGYPYLVVGTKADKLAKTKVPEQMLRIAENLNVDSRDTTAFSAETKFGRDQILSWIIDTAQNAVDL